MGEVAERVEDPGYASRSPVDLAAGAAALALADTGLVGDRLARLRSRIDVVAGIRQFELSGLAPANPFGRADNYPRAVAARLEVAPRWAILEIGGGQGPQHLVGEMVGRVGAGEFEAALLFGSEALSTVRHLTSGGAGPSPDWSQEMGGQLDDRGPGLEDMLDPHYLRHGLTGAIPAYALFEEARRRVRGQSHADYAQDMAELFAPFSTVAAANPLAAVREACTVDELAEVSARNRLIATPYRRLLVARDQVNQGAAVLIVGTELADELGIAPQRRVHLHAQVDAVEADLLARAELSRSDVAVAATRAALAAAEVDIAGIDRFDLYSCFPVAVSQIADAFGLAYDDPRGLTLTGGLPFFGGAGNNYSMHAIAQAVAAARARPGGLVLVTANGGILSKYSVGIYGTTVPVGPVPAVTLGPDGPPVVVDRAPSGPARVETATTVYASGSPERGILLVRMLGSGARALATTVPGDGEMLSWLAGDEGSRQVEVASRDGLTVARLPDPAAAPSTG